MSKKIIIFGWLNMILYANAYKLNNIEKMKNLCSALQYYSYS